MPSLFLRAESVLSRFLMRVRAVYWECNPILTPFDE